MSKHNAEVTAVSPHLSTTEGLADCVAPEDRRPPDTDGESARALDEEPHDKDSQEREARSSAHEGKMMSAEDPRSAPSTHTSDVWTEEPTSSQLYPNSRRLRELVQGRSQRSEPVEKNEQPSDEAPSIPPPPAPHEQARRAKPAKEPDSPTEEEVKKHLLTQPPDSADGVKSASHVARRMTPTSKQTRRTGRSHC